MCVCVCHLPISICACVLSHFSHVWLFVTSWTVAHQDFPGKKTRVVCHVLLQGIFLTQGLNLSLLCLLHWQKGSLPLAPSILFLLFLRLIYLILAVLSLCCCALYFSSCASRGYFLAVVLLICCGTWAVGNLPSLVVVYKLSCPTACGIFLDKGLNPCPPHWQADS